MSACGFLPGAEWAVRAERSLWPERPVRAERIGSVVSGQARCEPAERPLGSERTVWAERSLGSEWTVRAERVRDAGVPALRRTQRVGAGVPALPRTRGARRGGAPRRRALAGLRLLGYGGLVALVGDHDPDEDSGGGSADDGGGRGDNAMWSLHDRSHVEARGGRGELFVRSA